MPSDFKMVNLAPASKRAFLCITCQDQQQQNRGREHMWVHSKVRWRYMLFSVNFNITFAFFKTAEVFKIPDRCFCGQVTELPKFSPVKKRYQAFCVVQLNPSMASKYAVR